MPRYGFRCTQCGHEFEVSRPMSQASDPAVCPHDGAPGTRVFTAPPIISGSGGSSLPTPPSGGADHGHSHGPGTHTH